MCIESHKGMAKVSTESPLVHLKRVAVKITSLPAISMGSSRRPTGERTDGFRSTATRVDAGTTWCLKYLVLLSSLPARQCREAVDCVQALLFTFSSFQF